MLIVFTNVYVPENGGLERFNYLALREFLGRTVRFEKARGENIPQIVEERAGYGWTGNDLFVDYYLSQRETALRVVKFVPWLEETKPRLCLLGPTGFFDRKKPLFRGKIVAPDKYRNIIKRYFEQSQWYPDVQFLERQVDRQVRLGKADLAIDIVCSGRTMREEKLSIYDTIFDQSGFVLLTKDTSSLPRAP